MSDQRPTYFMTPTKHLYAVLVLFLQLSWQLSKWDSRGKGEWMFVLRHTPFVCVCVCVCVCMCVRISPCVCACASILQITYCCLQPSNTEMNDLFSDWPRSLYESFEVGAVGACTGLGLPWRRACHCWSFISLSRLGHLPDTAGSQFTMMAYWLC